MTCPIGLMGVLVTDRTRPPMSFVPGCGRELAKAFRNREWLDKLQRHDDPPSRWQIHAARDFGPVPVGGAEIIRFDTFMEARARRDGGAA